MPSSLVDTTRKSTWRLPHVPSSRRYPILGGLIDAFFGLRYQTTKFRRFASVEITACSQLLRLAGKLAVGVDEQMSGEPRQVVGVRGCRGFGG